MAPKMYKINKLGMEDLLFGEGTEVQNRNNVDLVVTKINAKNLPFDATNTLGEVLDLKYPSIDALTVEDQTVPSGRKINPAIASVASVTADIEANKTAIEANKTDIDNAYAEISTNSTEIVKNTADIATNKTDIASNEARIATNTADIATNTSAIATNTADIASAKTNIATNTADIASAKTDIATNTTNIATNTSAIATNTADITTNRRELVSAKTDIDTNRRVFAADIATNTADIATNTADIASAKTDIATNTADIATNTADIAANKTTIESNNLLAAKITSRFSGSLSGVNSAGSWVTVATTSQSTSHSIIMVSYISPPLQGGLITIDWGREGSESSLSVTNVSGLLLGVRLLREVSNLSSGEHILQVKINVDSLVSAYAISYYNHSIATAVSPIIEDTKQGFDVFKEFDTSGAGMATTDNLVVEKNVYSNGKLLGTSEDIATNKTDIADNNVKATKITSGAVSTVPVGEAGVEHWVTVASAAAATSVDTGRRHGRVIVSDQTSGRHSFIEIDWMRSYADSSFTVLNNGGHTRFITGVRILRKPSDTTYSENILQIRVDNYANFTVSVISDNSRSGWGTFTAITPIVEDTKVDFDVFRELTGIKYLGFGTSKGVKFGGDVYTDGHFYDNGKLLGLDKAKCYVDMDPEDFPGDRNTYGVVGLSAIKYQTPGNNFTVDVATNEIIINKAGYYNLEVVLNHIKGASTSVFSNARIFKNGNIALGGGSAGNSDAWFSLVVRALGENLVVGDRICVKTNGRNDNSHWSTFSIEEI